MTKVPAPFQSPSPVSIVVLVDHPLEDPVVRSGGGSGDEMSRIHRAQRPSHSAGGDQGEVHSRIWGQCTPANAGTSDHSQSRDHPRGYSTGEALQQAGLHNLRRRPTLHGTYIYIEVHTPQKEAVESLKWLRKRIIACLTVSLSLRCVHTIAGITITCFRTAGFHQRPLASPSSLEESRDRGSSLHEPVAFNAVDRGAGSGWTAERESLLAFRCKLSPSRCQ